MNAREPDSLAPRILAVDDNPADLELLTVAFDALGARVDLRTAHDGRAAVDMLQTELQRDGGWRPELVVVDLSMPRIDGLETIVRLRRNRELATVPLAVLSGSTRPADRDRALAAGAVTYLVKPARFDAIIDLLRELLERLPALTAMARQ